VQHSSKHKNRKSFVVLFGCVFLSFFFYPLVPLDHIILSLNKQTFWQQPKRNETRGKNFGKLLCINTNMTVESGAAVAESYLRVDVDMKFMHLLPARKVFMYALINIYVCMYAPHFHSVSVQIANKFMLAI